MHKGQDQVNFVEVYNKRTNFAVTFFSSRKWIYRRNLNMLRKQLDPDCRQCSVSVGLDRLLEVKGKLRCSVPFSSECEINVASRLCSNTKYINFLFCHDSVRERCSLQSKKGGKDQESIQSSTTPTQDTTRESDKTQQNSTHKRTKEVRPALAGDHKAALNRQESMTNTKHK